MQRFCILCLASVYGIASRCPPQGMALPHHYVFDLFALDAKLDLPATATRADVEKAIDGHIIGHAVLVGLFRDQLRDRPD